MWYHRFRYETLGFKMLTRLHKKMIASITSLIKDCIDTVTQKMQGKITKNMFNIARIYLKTLLSKGAQSGMVFAVGPQL